MESITLESLRGRWMHSNAALGIVTVNVEEKVAKMGKRIKVFCVKLVQKYFLYYYVESLFAAYVVTFCYMFSSLFVVKNYLCIENIFQQIAVCESGRAETRWKCRDGALGLS